MVGVILCTLIRYLGLWVFFFMFNWMFEPDYLDTCCFECFMCLCFFSFFVFLFCICICSAQMSMFHMERCSRNTLIIIIKTVKASAPSAEDSPLLCSVRSYQRLKT